MLDSSGQSEQNCFIPNLEICVRCPLINNHLVEGLKWNVHRIKKELFYSNLKNENVIKFHQMHLGDVEIIIYFSFLLLAY